MKGGLVESMPLVNTSRCKLSYVTFSRYITHDKSLIHIHAELDKGVNNLAVKFSIIPSIDNIMCY